MKLIQARIGKRKQVTRATAHSFRSWCLIVSVCVREWMDGTVSPDPRFDLVILRKSAMSWDISFASAAASWV